MSDVNHPDNTDQQLDTPTWERNSTTAVHYADDIETQRYLDVIRSVHQEWKTLEEQGDTSVGLSPAALLTVKEAVRSNVRRGAQIEMPPTGTGAYTLSELSMRTLVRDAIDSVPGVIALRTTIDYAPAESTRSRGHPTRIRGRVSAPLGARDLPQLARTIRDTITRACRDHLDLTVDAIDIHIEDLHEH